MFHSFREKEKERENGKVTTAISGSRKNFFFFTRQLPYHSLFFLFSLSLSLSVFLLLPQIEREEEKKEKMMKTCHDFLFA